MQFMRRNKMYFFATTLLAIAFELNKVPIGLAENYEVLPLEQNLLRRRPGIFGNGTLVTVSLFLSHIQFVDQKNGHASMSFYIQHKWHDSRLAWDHFENDTEQCVFVPSNEIWTPSDMGFGYNVIHASEPSSASDSAHVCHDGTITTLRLQRFQFAAVFDNTQFPYDEQQVDTSYGHPFAGLQEVDVTTDVPNLGSYMSFGAVMTKNAEWNLKDILCSREVYEYPKSRAYRYYPMIICHIFIERNAVQYVIFFSIPSIVVTFVGVLGLFYGAQFNCKEAKVQLALMSLMTLSVLSLSLSEDMPSSHKVSRMHKFYMCQMFVISFSAIFTCILLKLQRNRYFKGKQNHFAWIKFSCFIMFMSVLCTSGFLFFLH